MDESIIKELERQQITTLSGAIRAGADLVKEYRLGFLVTEPNGDVCGCALGTAAYAAGIPHKAGDDYEPFFGKLTARFGVPKSMLTEISRMHFLGQKNRAQIADWLEAQVL